MSAAVATSSSAPPAYSSARPWNPNYKHSERERWICIYPAYINARKSRAEGRKLPRNQCVDYPRSEEIRDVLSTTGLRCGVETKIYPREKDVFDARSKGRIRVQIRDDDGNLINPDFDGRIAVMRYVGANIPKLKTRQGQQPNPTASAEASGSKKKTKKKK